MLLTKVAFTSFLRLLLDWTLSGSCVTTPPLKAGVPVPFTAGAKGKATRLPSSKRERTCLESLGYNKFAVSGYVVLNFYRVIMFEKTIIKLWINTEPFSFNKFWIGLGRFYIFFRFPLIRKRCNAYPYNIILSPPRIINNKLPPLKVLILLTSN